MSDQEEGPRTLAEIGIVGEAHAVGRIQRLEQALAARDVELADKNAMLNQAQEAALFAQTKCLEAQDGCLKAQEGERDALQKRADAIEYAERLQKALRVAKCQLGFILDRHEDEQDCDQDADGHRTPNRDMNTVVDCNIAIAEIDAALAKNPTENRRFESGSMAEVQVKTGAGFESPEVAQGAKGPDGTSVKASAKSDVGASIRDEQLTGLLPSRMCPQAQRKCVGYRCTDKCFVNPDICTSNLPSADEQLTVQNGEK